MIVTDIRPMLAIALPLIACILILLTGEKRPNLREFWSIAAAGGAFALVASMAGSVRKGTEFVFTLFQATDTISFTVRTDAAGMLFACVSSFLYVVVIFYAIGYMRGHHEKNQTGFYAFFAMCICSALGIAFAANLVTFFIFFELLTMATWPLVFHARNQEAQFSGRKYLIYTLIPGQLCLAGIVIVYAISGTTDFVPGGFLDSSMGGPVFMTILFILLVGAGAVKAGMMPFHGWLPAAMVAPTPVSALLHAVAVVKAGAFCVVRVVGYVFGPIYLSEIPANQILGWFAVFTIICSSMIAIKQDNLKKRLAYSTVGQLSYVLLGICLITPLGIKGAIFHIVAHALMKITLFMCAGAIIVTAHKDNVSDMKGIGKAMPVTMLCYTIASLGIVGLPFLVGFISKSNLIMGALEQGNPVFVVVLLISSMLGLVYLLQVSYQAFFVKNPHGEFTKRKEATPWMLFPIVITAALSITFGLYPDFGLRLYTLAEIAANAVMR